MNPQDTSLLSQLRDIHSAPAAPWWPPAPGWWILAAIALLVLFLLLRRALVAYRLRQRKNRLFIFLNVLEHSIDPGTRPQNYLSSINRILKIVAIRAFPGEHCASMQGDAWARFLQARLEKSADSGQLAVLSRGPYQPLPDFDPAVLNSLARDWIRKYG